MKGLFRSPAVQTALALVLAGWLRLCLLTMRWRRENLEAAEAVWAEGGGVIVCFWHSRISISPACWDLKRAQTPRALISLSADGEFIARAVGRLGFPAIRGSSTKATRKGDKLKGGASAFRDGLRWIRGGGGLALTPDGPRGPAETMAEGAVLLALMSNAPVLLVGLACSPAIQLNSWDRAIAPLPFSRGAIVYGRMLYDPKAPPETLRDAWAAELSALTRRAEALCA